MEETRLQDLYMCLKNNGFDVYMPASKTGECLSSYVVVKHDGSNEHPEFSTDVDYYSILVYVPTHEYSRLETLIQEVKKVIKKDLYQVFRPTGQQTPSFYDESVNGHMISVEFLNYKKRE